MKRTRAYYYPTLEEFHEHQRVCRERQIQNDFADNLPPKPGLTQAILEECYRELQKSAGFVWRSHKGVDYRVTDMATPHLFYSLRMIWNNVVPPAFRVGKFKRYNDVGEWTDVYLEQATNALLTELLTREDEVDEVVSDSPTGETIHEQLCDLVMNCGALWTLSGGEGDPLDEAGGSGRAE
jgi:hypothetical protein